MRLTAVILIASLMQVSAAGFAQKISLSKSNASLKAVLREIKTKTGYNFIYRDKVLEKAKPVTINVNLTEVADVLKQIFEKQELSYTVDSKTVIIKPKAPSFLDNLVARFAAIDVRGVVVDGESGQALAGASVKVKGSGKVTTTGSDGAFFLPGVDEKDVIVVSFIGYVIQELKAKKDFGEIRLVMASADLEEVEINKGYYTEKRRLSTGSVGRVTADEISRQPVSNPLAALQGRVAGVQIIQQTGMPGGNFSVRIRGQNSLRSVSTGELEGNDPLYVVDGNPFLSSTLSNSSYTSTVNGGTSPLNSINPSDIESIEILKDADATAIYGSRGANGVILITTKKGKSGDTKFNLNIIQGGGQLTRRIDLLSRDQYLEMRREAFKNDGITNYPVNAYDLNGTWDNTRYTDWQKELIGGTAQYTDAQFSMSGGSENTSFLFGSAFHRETTVQPGNNSDKRVAVHFNLNNTSKNKRFKNYINVNYTNNFANLVAQDLTSLSLNLSPVAPALYKDDGSLNWENSTWENPLSYLKRSFKANVSNLTANATLNYKLTEGISLKTNFGYVDYSLHDLRKLPITSYNPSNTTAQNVTIFNDSYSKSWIIEPQLDWNRIIGPGKFAFTLGTTFQDQTSKGIILQGNGFATENQMEDLKSASSIQVHLSNYSKYRYHAIYSRINYNIGDKYIINITGRRDGSSRFGPDKKFANFGAIGTAWIFSKENYIQEKIPFLSFGKVRGSFGMTGSDQIGDYGFISTYAANGTYQGSASLNPENLLNPDYSWETNKKFEAALELGFFNNRVQLNTSWYHNRSSNQLVGLSLAPTTGFLNIQANFPATVQNTGLEFEISTKNLEKNDFSWSTNLNITFPNNKLVSYPNLEGSSYVNFYVVGKSLEIRKLYHYLGVDQQTGTHLIEDIDHNNIYNTLDRQSTKFIGQYFFGGIQNNIRYKNFVLDFLFQFVKQNGRNFADFGIPGSLANQSVEILNRWRNPGDLTNIQKFSATSSSAASLAFTRANSSEYNIVDASYIRLKNISLSYNLPNKFTNELKISSTRIYIQGQNLLTISKYQGIDPEMKIARTLPPLAVVTAGIQLTF